MHNSWFPVSLLGKGKKRDSVEHGSESTKQELSSKVEDRDSHNFRFDMLQSEIANITEKGGLVNIEGVEKLLDLMQLDKGERKMDLAGRILLAYVIASTSRHDCLDRFVQLEGVLLLADWLQEAHKGKSGDSNSLKYNDRSVEELFLALLRALDKLPVNIHALQTSNIGKSVNHLRAHKSPEIQKKAKSLIDIWKKRVEYEMTKVIDARTDGLNKTVSLADSVGIKHTVSFKAAAIQPSTCKSMATKSEHHDNLAISTPSLSGSLKSSSFGPSSVAITSNDMPCTTAGTDGAADNCVTANTDEKSCGSSHSQNNSQSCSSDHGKTATSRKKYTRSSAAGFINASKISTSRSRHRNLTNGLQKGANNRKSGTLSKNTTSAKILPQVSEQMPHLPLPYYGQDHRLIIRLPNTGISLSEGVNYGHHDGVSAVGDKDPSSASFDRRAHNDHKVQVNTCRSILSSDAKATSIQVNDSKGGIGSNDGDRSSTHVDEEHTSTEKMWKEEVLLKVESSPSTNGKQQGQIPTKRNLERSYDPSFKSINALIESCVKLSAPSSPLSAGDELGMNLLASVAAGEIHKSDTLSPDASPVRSLPAPEDACTKDKRSLSSDEIAMPFCSWHDGSFVEDSDKHFGTSASTVESQSSTLQILSGDGKSIEHEIEGKLDERSIDRKESGQASPSDMKGENTKCLSTHKIRKKRELNEITADVTTNKKRGESQPSDESKPNCLALDEMTELGMPPCDFICSSLIHGDNIGTAESCQTHLKEAVEESQLCDSLGNSDQPNLANKELNVMVASEEKEAFAMDVSETMNAVTSENSEPSNLPQIKKATDAILCSHSETGENGKIEMASSNHLITDDNAPSILVSVSTSGTGGADGHDSVEHSPDGELIHEQGSVVSKCETECLNTTCPKDDGCESDEVGERASSTKAVIVLNCDVSGNAIKCDFDLNEGLTDDNVIHYGQADLVSVRCSSSLDRCTSAPLTISSIRDCSAVPITVAAAAKGPFIPHEIFLKGKAEPGWKGSAATSAFRPAEPCRVSEMPFDTFEAPSDVISNRKSLPPLEFDLNVRVERNLESASLPSAIKESISEAGINATSGRSAGVLDLDLNKTDEGAEEFRGSSSRRLEAPLVPGRPASRASHMSGTSTSRREFDLNNGPTFDETCTESVLENPQMKSSDASFRPTVGNLGINNGELGNFSSWFAPGNPYQAVALSPFLPESGSQHYSMIAAAGAQRIMASSAGGASSGVDPYKGAVLFSSPALTFTSAQFPFSNFPFHSSFPVPSTSFSGGSAACVDTPLSGAACFHAVSSQFVGAAANSASSAYVRPYIISLPEGTASGGSSGFSQSWGRQCLDLNAGPGNLDSEGRDERLANALALAEQARMYQTAGGGMYQAAGGGIKRKESEGGWDLENFTYKRSSWQ